MAITMVGTPGTIAQTAAATTSACPSPAGTAANDVLTVILTEGNQASAVTATGWTAVTNANIAAGATTTDIRILGYYLVLAGAAAATYSFGFGTGCTSGIIIAAYRGVDTTTPIDVSAQAGVAASGGTMTIPAVTTVTNGALLIVGGGANTNTGAFTTTPTGYTLEGNIGGRRTNLHDLIQATAGASGTAAYAQANEMVGFQFALRPASAGASAPPYHPRLNTLLRM